MSRQDSDPPSSWSMSWDDDGNAVGAVGLDISPLHLPHNKVLVARVFGEPSPRSREGRVTFLCASDSGALVTRTEDGTLLWSETGRNPTEGYDAATEPFPRDPGGECRAMFDRFEAEIGEAHGFVTHVDVSTKASKTRRLIKMQAWQLFDASPDLLRPVSLDLRGRLSRIRE